MLPQVISECHRKGVLPADPGSAYQFCCAGCKKPGPVITPTRDGKGGFFYAPSDPGRYRGPGTPEEQPGDKKSEKIFVSR